MSNEPIPGLENVVESVGTELIECAVLAQVDGHLARRAAERSLVVGESLEGYKQDISDLIRRKTHCCI